MKRLLGRLVKIGIVLAVLGGLAYAAKKLMGGLGPEPGSDTAPKAWPSLIPEPAADATEPVAATAEPTMAPDASAAAAERTADNATGGTNGDAPAPSNAEA